MTRTLLLPLTLLCLVIAGCDNGPKVQPNADADQFGHSAPSAITAKANARVLKELPFDDQQDFEQARRGLIASEPKLKVLGENDSIVWDQASYDFLQGKAPASVNPSLWRQSQLNAIQGLFKVTEGIYQLRGFDLSNMSIIESDTGWIIVDPLTSQETAAAAIAFARKHLGEKPIRAFIFTHSHIDHFGGVLGIASAEDIARDNIEIIAPIGFMEEATSENIIAGIPMTRRSSFMYGKQLARSPRGHVSSGLGLEPPFGRPGILPPTKLIEHTGQELIIDGVRMIFQNAAGSEAPAELTFYMPDSKVFCGAELVSRNMHNIYTLRGAKVRDSLKWSGYIDQAIDLFGEADIYFASHHWPIWGNKEVIDFLKKQRDTYKFIHDQTVRLASEGLTPREIAEQITLPESLSNTFSSRGYYGTLQHNAKAVYQGYLGWYDANPANLNPLPPRQSAIKIIEYMGGGEAVMSRAQQSFDQGEYRWVAEVLNHLVFAQPNNTDARALLANTYDQLGYQSESGPWRDIYLTGALELRNGVSQSGFNTASAVNLLREVPVSTLFDSMAVRLNSEKAEGEKLRVNFYFTDIEENHVLYVENSVLHHRIAPLDPQATATIRLTHALYLNLAIGIVSAKDALLSDDFQIEGSKLDAISFFAMIDRPTGNFNIIEP